MMQHLAIQESEAYEVNLDLAIGGDIMQPGTKKGIGFLVRPVLFILSFLLGLSFLVLIDAFNVRRDLWSFTNFSFLAFNIVLDSKVALRYFRPFSCSIFTLEAFCC